MEWYSSTVCYETLNDIQKLKELKEICLYAFKQTIFPTVPLSWAHKIESELE